MEKKDSHLRYYGVICQNCKLNLMDVLNLHEYYWVLKTWVISHDSNTFSGSFTHYFLNQQLKQTQMHYLSNNKNSTSHRCINTRVSVVCVYIEVGLLLTSAWNIHEVDSLYDTVREWPLPGARQKSNIPTTQKTNLRPFSHKLDFPRASMFTMSLKATK